MEEKLRALCPKEKAHGTQWVEGWVGLKVGEIW